MSESWLQDWLGHLNLPEYLELLSQHGYLSPNQLTTIVSRDQLKVIGVTKMGHLSRLIRAIEKLRSDMGGGSSSEDMGSRQSSGSSLTNSENGELTCW